MYIVLSNDDLRNFQETRRPSIHHKIPYKNVSSDCDA